MQQFRRTLCSPTNITRSLRATLPSSTPRAFSLSATHNQGKESSVSQASEAFDPKKTSPESQHEAHKDDGDQPPGVNPGDPSVSKPPADEGVARSKEAEKGSKQSSGHGSPPKGQGSKANA